jgi:hypothetical protein
MPTTDTEQLPDVEQPKHPIHALTTYELRDYRRELEHAVTYFGKQTPIPPVRKDLQAALDEVLAEQAERARMAARG